MARTFRYRGALACHQNLNVLREKLQHIKGVRFPFSGTSFHEIVVQLNKPVESVLAELAKHKIQAGLELKKFYPELENGLLICVTETKTVEDLERFVNQLGAVL